MARTPAGLPAGIRVSDHISLGVIAGTFPIDEVRQVLAETGRASERERDLPAHVMVYYAVALALYAGSGTREVLRCLLEGLRRLWGAEAVRVAGKSGISQARTRLGAAPLRRLCEPLARPHCLPGPATPRGAVASVELLPAGGDCRAGEAMGRRLSMATRAELLEVVRERYGKARPAERRLILDEFVAVSGYHRKHAIRLLRQPGGGPAPDRRGRSPVYDAAVRAALVVVWEASDRICGKRLKAALPVLVPAMERHGHLALDEAVRSRLLAVSASTIDRLLRSVRARAGAGRRRSGATSAIRPGVRVRTFGDWGEPPPGFTEVDLVAHSGPSMAGAFAWTLVLTDVATGWTECVPLPCRDGVLVVEALTRLRGVLPFPLGGADFDNDSVFMNEDVVGWCRANGIEVTRSRAYRKNDQAWVEQKNGAVVRRLVGHDRLEGVAATGELARLYASARLFVNFFQPSFKLAAKRRDGARFSRRYHAPATPHARLLATGGLEPGVEERLAAEVAGPHPRPRLGGLPGSQG